MGKWKQFFSDGAAAVKFRCVSVHEKLLTAYEDDPESQFRAANLLYIILAGYTLILCLLGLFIFSGPSMIDADTRNIFAPLFILVGLFFGFCLQMVLNRKLELARTLVLGIVIVAVLSAVTLTGGFPRSMASVSVFIPIIMGYCLYGGRTGHSISILLTTFLLCQWFISKNTGIVFPDHSSAAMPEANMAITLAATLFIACLALAIFDISNRKYIKRANAAMVSKTNFLSNTSHEIRTPMNGIIGMSEVMMRTTQLDQDQIIYMEAIHKSGTALMTIIEDILDYSRLEAGNVEIKQDPFDLFDLAKELQTLMSINAADKNVVVQCHYPADLPRKFIGDAGRIRQVLINLLGNAIKFTENGHVGITVSVEKTDIEAEVKIEIKDSGIGISAEKLPTIFEHFTQAESGTTQKFGGTGLGLSIAHKLVELMNGRIGVVSQEHVGSTFWISLPLPLAHPSAEPQISQTEDILAKFSSVPAKEVHQDQTAQIHPLPTPIERRALIVSSDPLVIDEFGMKLRSMDLRVFHTHQIATVKNWMVALEFEPDEKPIIIVDGSLSAIDLSEVLLQVSNSGKKIKTIAVSPRVAVGYNPALEELDEVVRCADDLSPLILPQAI
ncbi:MAG: hypothetical protein HKN36_00820 [Hellea sp.]|nr:hypothetical protein [Hellea sp.]